MKGGRTSAGQRAAGSHTAALAGSTTAVDALFRQAGVIRADTLEELLDVAVLLSRQPLPRGRRVAVLTNAGGLGHPLRRRLRGAGLELPAARRGDAGALAAVLPREASLANPIDMLGSATAATYEAAMPHVLADPGIDAVIVLFVPPRRSQARTRSRRRSAGPCRADPARTSRCWRRSSPPAARRRRCARPPAIPRSPTRSRPRARSAAPPSGGVAPAPGRRRRRARGHRPAAAAAVVADGARRDGRRLARPGRRRARLLEAYGIPLVPERVARRPPRRRSPRPASSASRRS